MNTTYYVTYKLYISNNKMQITSHAMQHIKRAEQLMAFGAPKRKKKIYTTPGKSISPRNLLQWWPEAHQLQYPLHVHMGNPSESQAVIKLTLGNIYLERVSSNGNDNEGNLKLQVNGKWPIIEKSGRYRNRVGKYLRFTLDTEKEEIVNRDRMGDRRLVYSTYGSQFYEYVLKDLISNFFVRLILLLQRYEINDLTDSIYGHDITIEGFPLLSLLHLARDQVRYVITIIDQDGERHAGDRAEAVGLLWPSMAVAPLVDLLRGAMQ